MSRLTIALAAALIALPMTGVAPAAVAVAAAPSMTLSGPINADNAARLTGFIADRVGKVVTLKLTIAAGTSADFKAKGYMAEPSGDLFIVFKQAGPDKIQVGAPAAKVRKVGGTFVLEGRFKVEHAGMGQGTIAYVLRPD